MPAVHFIDEENKVIFTTWNGEPSDSDLVEALNNYFSNIKNKPELSDFNELVDFSDTRGVKLSINTLIELGKVASRYDKPPQTADRGKLAIVVTSSLAYGLARMYGIYREYNPQSNKEVLVFRNRDEAVAWLKSENGTAPEKFLSHSETKPG